MDKVLFVESYKDTHITGLLKGYDFFRVFENSILFYKIISYIEEGGGRLESIHPIFLNT